MHAAGLAEELGCSTVLVPALAGLFSSLGLLFARPEFHDVHSCHLDARAVDPADVGEVFERARRRGSRPRSTGAEAEWVRSAELRYGGQTWEVEVELDAGPVDARALAGADRPLRGRARAPLRRPRRGGLADRDPRPAGRAASGPSSAVDRLAPADGRRPADGGRTRGALRRRAGRDVPVRSRESIGEQPEPGPLLVDEYDTTVVVRPGWTARRDPATATLDPGARW